MRLDVLTVEECSHIDGSTLTTVFPGSALGPVARGSGYATIGVSRDRCPFTYFGRQWDWAQGVHLLREILERLSPPRLLRLLDTLVRPIEQAGSVR